MDEAAHQPRHQDTEAEDEHAARPAPTRALGAPPKLTSARHDQGKADDQGDTRCVAADEVGEDHPLAGTDTVGARAGVDR